MAASCPMAVRAVALATEEPMPTSDQNTKILLQAIDAAQRESRESLTGVREAVAEIRAEVKNLSGDMQHLTVRVEKIDDVKATRTEVTAIETRFERSVAEVRASAAFESGRLSQDWESRIAMMAGDLEAIKGDVKELNSVRWRIVGACLLLGTVAGAFFAWVFHFLPHG